MLTASEITAAGDGQASSDVLLLGAAGNSGRLIAAGHTSASLRLISGPDMAAAVYAMRLADMERLELFTFLRGDPHPYREDLTTAIVGVDLEEAWDAGNVVSLADWAAGANRALETS